MKIVSISLLISLFLLHSVNAQVRINTSNISRSSSSYSGVTTRISNPVVIRSTGITPGVAGGSNTNSIILRNINTNSTSIIRR